jgi:hypothetical protein
MAQAQHDGWQEKQFLLALGDSRRAMEKGTGAGSPRRKSDIVHDTGAACGVVGRPLRVKLQSLIGVLRPTPTYGLSGESLSRPTELLF